MSSHQRSKIPTRAETAEAARAIAGALPETLKYAIVGGAACALLGSERQTLDVDFVVPQGSTIEARAALRKSSKFQVQQGTNYTTYTPEADQAEPIDIEILAPPTLFRVDYTAQSPVVQLQGGVRVLHPADILASKCASVLARSTEDKRNSDSEDIGFLLKYILEHEEHRDDAALLRLGKIATKEWIEYYLQLQPQTKVMWVALGLYKAS